MIINTIILDTIILELLYFNTIIIALFYAEYGLVFSVSDYIEGRLQAMPHTAQRTQLFQVFTLIVLCTNIIFNNIMLDNVILNLRK